MGHATRLSLEEARPVSLIDITYRHNTSLGKDELCLRYALPSSVLGALD